MAEFLSALFEHIFIRNALLIGVFASVACGTVGSYVVARRITYIAGSIAHSVLAGIGIVIFLRSVYGWDWLHPIHGAILTALISAIIIGLVSLHAQQREDTVIGAIWAIGMAIGFVFIAKTPGYTTDLMSYLFGNILMVSTTEIWLVIVIDVVVVSISFLFYDQLLAVCFDEQFARLRGVNVDLFYLLLLCMTALTVVMLVTIVGIVMVIALITLPSAIASNLGKSLKQMMLISSILSVIFSISGFVVSYGYDLPTGPVIILIASAGFLISLPFR